MEMGMLEITDCRVLSLMQLCCSEEFDLAECGPNVTDLAGEAIASSESFKRLNLSGSIYQYSTKDDAIVKYWDITTESKIYDLLGHKDYVRCGDASPVSDDMFVSGSYDHTVKVWDDRVMNSGSAKFKITHSMRFSNPLMSVGETGFSSMEDRSSTYLLMEKRERMGKWVKEIWENV
ncbi:hypothetical protein KY290_033501 [Solanum tuberosum]|uniref:F-box and wd40 domain protein n=1 Tax=Solanum tuberosum TaxID=4113 RepID=A0ABQ7U110_SOLTU|nr:hypothetical protein KY289_032859 [Solanum tuberosum]KAH0647506.1 hypothetical protein KY285_032754 [Solanum tuberosum]KAH0740458.1 hypothetical protein KY290_033501 [Solanum tuberosum]